MSPLRDALKRTRYAANFLRRRMVHVNLQLLYRCNMRCRICDFWREGRGGETEMTLARVEEVSGRLAAFGPQIVSIGGGEPLLHRDITGVVRALARHHFPVMITNGAFVTPRLARGLFEAGAEEVSVSLDYADPARHDAQRGTPGAFDRAVEALRVLEANRVRDRQRVHMISVIMDDNVDEVEPLLRLCREIGVTYLVTLYSDGRGTKDTRAVPRDVSARLLDLRRRYPEFVVLRGYVGRFSEAVRAGGVGPCRAGVNLMNVDSRGNVSLCIDRMDDPAGNLLTDPPGEIARRLRAKAAENRCRGCWTSCRGSIETLLLGRDLGANLLDYWRMTRPMPRRTTAAS